MPTISELQATIKSLEEELAKRGRAINWGNMMPPVNTAAHDAYSFETKNLEKQLAAAQAELAKLGKSTAGGKSRRRPRRKHKKSHKKTSRR